MTAKFISTVEIENDDNIFENLLNNEIVPNLEEGKVVNGRIVKIENDYVVVSVGLKSEGRIPISEFKISSSTPMLKVGDEVEVYIDKLEGTSGKTVISREKAIREASWKDLEEAFKKEELVEGIPFNRVKGGFAVDVRGVIAFLPGSQVDLMPVDPNEILNKVEKFKILTMNPEYKNIVVSRRAVIEEQRSHGKEKILEEIQAKLEKGEDVILTGTVKNITDYGAFINLGSIDGLLHKTDISWSRINHPSEKLSLYQVITTKVKELCLKTRRIHLGLKQLQPSPWENLEGKYKPGDIVNTKVLSIHDNSVFVEVEDGVNGLVPSNEISWAKQDTNCKNLFLVGQDLKCQILEVDMQKHRMSLSIKRLTPNPWKEFAQKHNVGEVLTLKIRNVKDYALFVAIGDVIDGIIHQSDISWEGGNVNLIKNYKKGQEVQCKIMAINAEESKVSLSIKHLTEDPYKEIYEKYNVGDIITCVVNSTEEEVVNVLVEDKIPGIIKKSELSSDREPQDPKHFKEGSTLKAKITNIDRGAHLFILSIKEYEIAQQKAAQRQHSSENADMTIGSILEDAKK